MRILYGLCVVLALIALANATSATRYLFQVEPNSPKDIEYLQKQVEACAASDPSGDASIKSAFHRSILRFGVVSATLTPQCYQKMVVKNSIVQSIARLIEIDHPLTSLIKVLEPPKEDVKFDTLHLQRLVDGTETAYNRNSQANLGKGVHLYVVDAGVADHDELEKVQRYSVPEDATNKCTRTVIDASDEDEGTRAAGLAVGKKYGVAPEATLVSVRVFACEGTSFLGHVSSLLDGLSFVHKDYSETHQSKAPSVVSITVGSPYSRILNKATTELVKAGITVVVAAGQPPEYPVKKELDKFSEETMDSCNASPASALGVVSVGATLTVTSSLAPFSNTGACVTLYAPGSQVTTIDKKSKISHTQTSGTGASAAIVAGLAATFLGASKSAPPHQVRQYLLDSSREEASLTKSVQEIAKTSSKFSLAKLATFGPTAMKFASCDPKGCLNGIPLVTKISEAPESVCACACEPGFAGEKCALGFNSTALSQPRVEIDNEYKDISPLGSTLNSTNDVPTRRASTMGVGGADLPGFPLNSFARYQRMQSIYLANELKEAGIVANAALSGLAFRVFAPISEDIDDAILAIGFVPADVVALSGFVPTIQVFRGKISAKTSAASSPEALVPFAFEAIGGAQLPKWDGVSNLVVEYAATNQIAPKMLETKNIERLSAGAVYLASVDGGFSRSIYSYSLEKPGGQNVATTTYPFINISKLPLSSRFVPIIRISGHAPGAKCLEGTKPLAGKCGDKGICSDDTGKCVCARGFKGELCREVDNVKNALCAANPKLQQKMPKCQNGGLCVQGTCECKNGFFGQTCAENPPSFCVLNHGHCGTEGECIDNGACVCKDGFVGSTCQVQKIKDGLPLGRI